MIFLVDGIYTRIWGGMPNLALPKSTGMIFLVDGIYTRIWGGMPKTLPKSVPF
jgi:hypothetical protein